MNNPSNSLQSESQSLSKNKRIVGVYVCIELRFTSGSVSACIVHNVCSEVCVYPGNKYTRM